MTATPSIRIRSCTSAPVRPDGAYVLYWMIAFRRLGWNFALEHAAGRARALGRPLVILEPLRCGYRWACDRFHHFILDGMAEHARRLAGSAVLYHPYVEPAAGAGKGLLEALAARSCLVVTDDSPAFFYPRMIAVAAARLGRLPVRLEAVDSNGLLPLRAAERTFVTAYDFRRTLQKLLPRHLGEMPAEDPLAAPLPQRLAALPAEVLRRWPAASPEILAGDSSVLSSLPIDHAVGPVAGVEGGETAAAGVLARFLDERLAAYGEGRNNLGEPDEEVTSGLSPYLHFGHIATHRVFAAVASRERWTPERLAAKSNGAREGWWGMSAAAEKFLDELITWREVGYNRAALSDDSEAYESLPEWAQATLAKHAGDPRDELYDLAGFAGAATHDTLWNAAQRQFVRSGRIHNYLRMLWGKKILHWSASPREALAIMIELNNRYALDGRDPNSASGIFWCLGRYDRPWPPERPVFGSIRYMSSESTRRKLKVDGYVARWSNQLSLL
ncbi:MAG TPA: deoxyribodipyrimidine photolyase [Thermoanaerobaculia bacterium]|nr:deoxyribodipyrimidine photolyase [Thermoanaerobaculia bacterium]